MRDMEEMQEALFLACEATDMNKPEQATALAQTLVIIILSNVEMMAVYEEKIQEIMTVKEYGEWVDKEVKPMLDKRTKDDMKEILSKLGGEGLCQ